MIEDTMYLSDLTASCGGSAVRGSFSGDDETFALRMPQGQLLLWNNLALPLTGGKTSVSLFTDVSMQKSEPILSLDLPVPGSALLSKGVFLRRVPNFYHFMVSHLPSYAFLQAAPGDTVSVFTPAVDVPSSLDQLLPALMNKMAGGRPIKIMSLPEATYNLDDVLVPLIASIPTAIAFHRNITLPMCEEELGHLIPAMEDKPLKIFLRRASPSRQLLNHEEVEQWFVRRGYRALDPGEMKLQEQALLFARATHIAGLEGGTFTNLLFAVKAVSVVMLSSALLKAESFFTRIAAACHMPFETVYGRVPGTAMLRGADFIIDTADLEKLERDGKI